jgi:porphobilinogen synthase
MPHPHERPRRLRRSEAIRRLVRETRLSPADLVYPMFVREDISEPRAIDAMVGQSQHTVESLLPLTERCVKAGVGGVMLFGIPATKDARGSQAWADDGIVQRALTRLRREFGSDLVVMADTCLDEYTDHGHCGVLREDGSVDNDATLELYGRAAVAQATAGAAVVAPSGMMDGQVAAIRAALDEAGHEECAILAYSAKFASVMYGPFRDAADCAPKQGDRRAYQMDVANGREAQRELALDIAEGADMVMVKPALTCLDVVAASRAATNLPLAAYVVSGEYAMVHAAARDGAFDTRAAVLETLTAVRRAGADIVISYDAPQAAVWLAEGR